MRLSALSELLRHLCAEDQAREDVTALMIRCCSVTVLSGTTPLAAPPALSAANVPLRPVSYRGAYKLTFVIHG